MTCEFCGRPTEVCHEPVDSRWPQVAREAYEVHELTHAPKCDEGQAADLQKTRGSTRLGWNVSRAVLHPFWVGAAPAGLGPLFYAEFERSKYRRGIRPGRAT